MTKFKRQDWRVGEPQYRSCGKASKRLAMDERRVGKMGVPIDGVVVRMIYATLSGSAEPGIHAGDAKEIDERYIVGAGTESFNPERIFLRRHRRRWVVVDWFTVERGFGKALFRVWLLHRLRYFGDELFQRV